MNQDQHQSLTIEEVIKEFEGIKNARFLCFSAVPMEGEAEKGYLKIMSNVTNSAAIRMVEAGLKTLKEHKSDL